MLVLCTCTKPVSPPQCDGTDLTAKVQDLKLQCLLFLNIPRYWSVYWSMSWFMYLSIYWSMY